jgi:hypothetical protein
MAANQFDAGAEGFGLSFAARSFGAVVGLLALIPIARRVAGDAFYIAGAAWGCALACYAIAPRFDVALACLFLAGVASAWVDVIGQTLLQELSGGKPGAGMGIWVFSIGSGPLGLITLGLMADVLGVILTQLLAGAILGVATIAIWRLLWVGPSGHPPATPRA